MQQELITEHAEAPAEAATRKDRTTFEAAITDADRLTIELTRRTETLSAERVREDGETRTVIDLDEAEETTTFTIPSPDTVYAHVLPGPWDVLAEALAPRTTVLPAAWEPAIPETPPMSTGPLPPPALGGDRPFHRMSTRSRPRTDDLDTRTVQRREEYRPRLATPRTLDAAPAHPDSEPPVQEALGGQMLADAAPAPARPEASRLEEEAWAQDGLLAMVWTGNVVKAFYDPEENENGTSQRLLYTVDAGGTVKDTLLDLVDSGIIEATITRQPFYSPQPFEKDGELVQGWTDAYAVVALDGMPIQMTEFSYGSDILHLAEDDIASVDVSPGDIVDFAAAEVYTCGTDRETTTAAQEAWENHDRYTWFDDDWERSIYAALADGYTFEGSPLDLSHAPRVREAYLEAFGEAPEDVFDNVVYRR